MLRVLWGVAEGLGSVVLGSRHITHTVQLSGVHLRSLRPPAPTTCAACRLQAERLAQRLQSICAEEGLRCEKLTLRLLVERTDCDIRSCLNTLQVGRRAGGRAAGRGDVVDCCIGR